jgi:hypothetical protein
MKLMKYGFIVLVSLLAFNLFALEDIEKLLIEKAKTPAEKKVVKEYLLKVSKDHKELAQKYRKLSKSRTGGKARYQKSKRTEMQELAKKFEDDAKVYETAANAIE